MSGVTRLLSNPADPHRSEVFTIPSLHFAPAPSPTGRDRDLNAELTANDDLPQRTSTPAHIFSVRMEIEETVVDADTQMAENETVELAALDLFMESMNSLESLPLSVPYRYRAIAAATISANLKDELETARTMLVDALAAGDGGVFLPYLSHELNLILPARCVVAHPRE